MDPEIQEKSILDDDLETRIMKSILEDNKPQLISLLRRHPTTDSKLNLDRSIVVKLLHLCCTFDSVDCATSLVNGEFGSEPVLNEPDEKGMSVMHAAASANSARCVELLLKKHARTDLKCRDGRRLLPVELSLLNTRMDVIWNPDEHSIEDLVVQISEKDLTTLELLCEKTKELGDVAYKIAIAGRGVDLAALLVVAADRINESVLTVHDVDLDLKEKTTIYEGVIKEAVALGRTSTSSTARVANRYSALSESERDEKRKLLLREIELLQLYGAVALAGSTDKKLPSPLIRATQAGDEAIIELLLKTNTDVNGVDADGNSALHWCLKTYKKSCLQLIKIMYLLLKHGARVNQKNKLGLTAVHIAAANDNLQALQVLLLEDPDCINYKTEMKETALFFAAKNDCKNCAELLLRWGASTRVLNLRKQRPVDVATSQDMRFVLNNANISIVNRPIQQKYTTSFQGDDIVSETCKELITLTDEGNTTDRSCTSAKTEICKYFHSPNGCVRGTNCFYAHVEEELRQMKQGRGMGFSQVAGLLERKIFVGGLPQSIDSDSLSNIFEEKFGSVDNAMVVGFQTGDKMQSRGFGFIIFKDKKSVSAAVEAHHVTIMGKQVEIKSALPKCLLQAEFKKSTPQPEKEQVNKPLPLAQAPREKTAKEIASWKMPREKAKTDTFNWDISNAKTVKEIPGKTSKEVNSELRSWVDTLICGQRKVRSNESRTNGKGNPKWLRIFKKWLPSFLQKVSKRGGEYALSSVKADFRAAFDLELDHASLGFSKLSDFIKSVPDLCRVKYVPMGHNKTANHMILLPSQLPQPVTMDKPSSHATSIDDSSDGDSTDAKKLFQKPALLSTENDDLIDSSTMLSPKKADENPPDTSASLYSRFLHFLKPDPIFHARPWVNDGSGGDAGDTVDDRGLEKEFQVMKPRSQGGHLVLEALGRKRKSSSVFFLREYDFYHKYKASIAQGRCFGCNGRRILWTNFPCMHLVWCADCKLQAMMAARVGEHKCVVCDIKVQKIDLISCHENCQPILDKAYIEFPPFDPDYLRNPSSKKFPSQEINQLVAAPV